MHAAEDEPVRRAVDAVPARVVADVALAYVAAAQGRCVLALVDAVAVLAALVA